MKTITILISRTLACLGFIVMSTLAHTQTTANPASPAVAGRIEFVNGNAQIKKPSGSSAPVQKGSTVAEGDTISTAGASNVQIKFTDTSMVALEANSEFKISNYTYNGRADGSENLLFDFLRGTLRTVSGLIGKTNKKAYKLQTATATIGIRGTAGKISTDAAGTSIATSEGAFILFDKEGKQSIDVPAGRVGFVGADGLAPKLIAVRPGMSDSNSQAQLLDDFNFARGNRIFITRERDATGSEVTLLNVGSVVVDSNGPSPAAGGFDYVTVYLQNGAPIDNASLGKFELSREGDPYRIAIKSGNSTYEIYRGDATGPRSANAAQVAERDRSLYMLWGRWSNGVVTIPPQQLDGSPSVQVQLTGNQSYHYVVGLPATNVPTAGVFSYDAVGATQPTSLDGSFIGTMNLRYFVADFTQRKIGLGFDVKGQGTTYAVNTTGGAANTTNSELNLRTGASGSFSANNLPTSYSGPAGSTTCNPFCSTFVRGSFAGPGATEAGFQYAIRPADLFGLALANGGTAITGVAVVRRK